METPSNSAPQTNDPGDRLKSKSKETAHQYLAHIDGLRAIAVLSVIFYHLNLGCSGGFVGVDVFFVISGYLITGLILRDLDLGKFRILDFWERRIRRILPAVTVVVISVLLAGMFLLPADLKELGESALAQSTLSSNFYFFRTSGYFDKPSELKPLLHTWSLAVEEQFYVLFPFVLIGIHRFRRSALLPLVIAATLASLALCIYCSYWYPRSNFFLLPGRAWELLLGALIALAPARWTPPRWLAESVAIAGLGGIVLATFGYDESTRFPGVAALPPCLGAAFLIWANRNRLTVIAAAMASPPLVLIGQMSYSLYLWHWPILVFVKYWSIDPLSVVTRLLLLVFVALASVLSWKFVETPIRKRAIFKTHASIFALAGVSTLVICTAGIILRVERGFPSRMPKAVVAYTDPDRSREFQGTISYESVLGEGLAELGPCDRSLPIDILISGDSHGWVLLPLLDELCKQYHVRAVASTKVVTNPLIGFKSPATSLPQGGVPYQDGILEFFKDRHIKHLFLVANWDRYAEHGNTDKLSKSFLQTVSAYRGTGARIWYVKDVPSYPWSIPNRLGFAVMRGEDISKIGMLESEQRLVSDRLTKQIIGDVKEPALSVLDPTDFLVDQSHRCMVAKNGKSYYWDENHLTVDGAMELRPLFEPIIKQIAEERGTRATMPASSTLPASATEPGK